MTAPYSPVSDGLQANSPLDEIVASPQTHPRPPKAPKLRDSCDACASSKVKCPKDKPVCSRCARRGITCEYVATRRGERRHNRRSVNTQSTASSRNSGVAGNGRLVDVGSYSDAVISPSILNDWTMADVDSTFASPISLSIPGFYDSSHDLLGHDSLFPVFDSTSSNVQDVLDTLFPTPPSTLKDAIPEAPTISIQPNTRDLISTTGSSNTTLQTLSDIPYAQSHPTAAEPPSCGCLAQALGIMNRLFPETTGCITSQSTDNKAMPTPPTMQAVLAKNEEAIDAVTAIMRCSCTQDGYLLVVVSLIVFKVMSWYAAAARQEPPQPGIEASSTCTSSPSLTGASLLENTVQQDSSLHNSRESSHTPLTQHSLQQEHSGISRSGSVHLEQVIPGPVVIGSYCIDGQDSAHMAAQLVLSELHRVQRLVKQLEEKLKAQADNYSRQRSVKDLDAGLPMILPFSADMLHQFVLDLKKRLRELSAEIMGRLRRQ